MNRSFAVYLRPSIAAVLLFSLLAPAGQAQPKAAPSRWEETIARFEQQDRQSPPEPGSVLFVGSSSIRMWDTAASFPDRRTVNRGFGGSQISDVLQYADRIVWKHQPRVIVFYSGDNDVAAGKPVERVVEDFCKFAEQARQHLPETDLIYLPIKPSAARWKLWPQMAQVNARIKAALAEHQRVHYVDTATPMLGEDGHGQPRPELLAQDGLHLSPAGYRLWTEIVEQKLAEILKDTR